MGVPMDVAHSVARPVVADMQKRHKLRDDQALRMFRGIVHEIAPTHNHCCCLRYESLTKHKAKQLITDLGRCPELAKIKAQPAPHGSGFDSYLDRYMRAFARVLEQACHPSADLVWAGGESSVTEEVVAVSIATMAARRRGFVDHWRAKLSSAILAYLKPQRFDLSCDKGRKLLTELINHASMQRLYVKRDVPDFDAYTLEFVAALADVAQRTCLPFVKYILRPEQDEPNAHASPLEIAVTLSDTAAKRHGFTEDERLRMQKAVMAHLLPMDNGVPSVYYHAQHGQRGGNLLRIMRAHAGPRDLDADMDKAKWPFDVYLANFMEVYTRVARDSWERDYKMDVQYEKRKALLAQRIEPSDHARLLIRQQETDRIEKIRKDLMVDIHVFVSEPERKVELTPEELELKRKRAADRKARSQRKKQREAQEEPTEAYPTLEKRKSTDSDGKRRVKKERTD
jgi:hypothetical protein